MRLRARRRRTGRPAATTVVIVLASVLSAACSKATPTASSSDTPTAILSEIAEPTTPPTTTPPTTPAFTPPVEDLPASWKLCQNPIRGSSMGYPGDWYTTSLSPSDACSLFHPEPFTIVPNSEGPLVALHVVQSDFTADGMLDAFTDPAHYTTVMTAPTTVVDRPAYRFEVVSLGVALIDEGTRFYGYIIDRGGKAFAIYTLAAADETRYNNWKFVVDTAKGTLKFDH